MNFLTARPIRTRAILLICSFLLTGGGALHGKAKENLLGPTGIFGTSRNKEIRVVRVEKDSPAAGSIKVGDVIVGANGTTFRNDPRRDLVVAINESEAGTNEGKLVLDLKNGTKAELQLQIFGAFSESAPADCPKTRAIVTAVADRLMADEEDLANDRMCLGWMGLMATGEDKYLRFVRKNLLDQPYANPDRGKLMSIVEGEVDGSMASWHWGYPLIALSEYHLLTGDKSVLREIETYALALSKGQDSAGTWGHRMATPERGGRLPGYAHINQPSLACFIGLVLAEKCGVDDPVVLEAIKKCQRFFNSFTGKGTIPYGVHDPNNRQFENNGMGAMTAIAMSLLGDREAARFFSRQTAADYDRLETGHASYVFNTIWSPLGANVAGPEVTRQYNKRSRWLYTLYRSWDNRFTYNGEGHRSLSTSGALLLNYCMPRKKLFITGKNADTTLWAKGDEVGEIINLSQLDYWKLSVDELLALFDHEAPQVRHRAILNLRERQGDFLNKIEKMIAEGNDAQQKSAIVFFGHKCPGAWALPRLDLIGKVLRDTSENPEVRAMAASALCWHKPQDQPYYQDTLRFLVEERPDDVLGLIDKKVGSALVAASETPFSDGLVQDKDLFYAAVQKLSRNPRQQARGNAIEMLADMPAEDFSRIADEVKYVVLNRDPSSHSYHNPQHTLLRGGQLLARLGIKEGPEWALQTMRTKDGKNSFKVRATVGVLSAYGANAKDVVEEIKKDEKLLETLSGGRFSKNWNALIKSIDSGVAAPVISFEEAKAGKLAQ